MAGQQADWADLFDLLIAHGHQHSEILRYTLAQFRAYVERAERRGRQAVREAMFASRAGQLDAKGFQAALKTLED